MGNNPREWNQAHPNVLYQIKGTDTKFGCKDSKQQPAVQYFLLENGGTDSYSYLFVILTLTKLVHLNTFSLIICT